MTLRYAATNVRAGLGWNGKGVLVRGSDPDGNWANQPRPDAGLTVSVRQAAGSRGARRDGHPPITNRRAARVGNRSRAVMSNFSGVIVTFPARRAAVSDAASRSGGSPSLSAQ